ncbi:MULTISPECIES: DUF808 family protein [Tatumella]|uniref:DUF808 family protein n=1 Tax=Tatumella punctata TaxID=399969 RepID=A0ABW1VTW0_9GAMM|nr:MULTISPECIES: DUF808 family protein [unclassified Tatumella]MBS0856691.1 DUF808 family protein [Tatumella sp. JGM16]MBS0878030.1 DUF808 family protein [Tatumella sp. JGM82]MBS0891247.1 DUF808 family protein [Tatumella sp. JGM94]MBS0895140.1 DUF808 family protein [Tatumella sp. JGM130]MBS0902626.1 DUF808 family protein [Tatumella sp. JGM100]
MAGTSLLALLDDIATLLDDISVMGKVAAKKTAGVLGDDLSLNAQQVTGVKANRELPVVWGVAKGSLLNKVILVPLALLISAFVPWLITPLLMLGGAYLSYEGMEKIIHWLTADKQRKTPEARQKRLENFSQQDAVRYEKDKIKGAIRTDFILSAEIVALTLGIVSEAPLLNQILILSGIALLVTVGVYGIVALIVRIDDFGYWLQQKTSSVARRTGDGLLVLAPLLMKILSVVGTLAMLLVGGGIAIHGIPWLHHWVEQLSRPAGSLWLSVLSSTAAPLVTGAIIGSIVLCLVKLFGKIRREQV